VDAHRLTSGDRFGSGVKTGVATPQALGLDAGGAEPVSLKTPGEVKVRRLAGFRNDPNQKPPQTEATGLHHQSRSSQNHESCRFKERGNTALWTICEAVIYLAYTKGTHAETCILLVRGVEPT